MLAGSWKWNLIIGTAGFVITFILSIVHNTIMTTFLRSIYAFLFFFIIVYLPRLLVKQTMEWSAAIHTQQEEEQNVNRGQNIDLTTPEEDEQFQPLVAERIDKNSDEIHRSSNE